ncbi:MAG: S8 family serine peptidase [Planctomycetia bacterium]
MTRRLPVRALLGAALLLLLPLASSPQPVQAAPPAADGPGRGRAPGSAACVPGELLVRFAAGATGLARAAAHADARASVAQAYDIVAGLEHVRLEPGVDAKAALEAYRRHPAVAYAEPNWVLRTCETVPNDPSFGQLWGLRNSGQTGGTAGADIDATLAWDLSRGRSDGSVVVAVIDTGIDYGHPDLAANMWANSGEVPGNGLDDDGNGYVDDVRGYDFANSDSDPFDDDSHGTHCAGTIGAAGGNGVGVAGVCWSVKMMAMKFLGADGSGSISGAISCMQYVLAQKRRGVPVVATSNSWGGGGVSQALLDTILAHKAEGILFVCAAGNSSSDNDAGGFYPASYDAANLLAVAATTHTDAKAGFSSYGRCSVHVGAPGESILSTTPGATYASYSGTSMATPHVAGLAALLKSYSPTLGWLALKSRIMACGDATPAMGTATLSRRRINAWRALTGTGAEIVARTKPAGASVAVAAGQAVPLAALHLGPDGALGPVTASVRQTGQSIVLQAASPDEGLYTASFTPPGTGTWTLDFPGGDSVDVMVLSAYRSSPATYAWRTLAGTSLDLSDDSSATLALPFPVRYAGGSFSTAYVSSNGTLGFSAPFIEWNNAPLGSSTASAAGTLVAPFWDDLYCVPGTAQNVFWGVLGTAPARELVVEWRDVRHYVANGDALATVRFQLVFPEGSSDVLAQYADATFGGAAAASDLGASATAGVQVSSTMLAQHSCNTPSLGAGQALRWSIDTSAEPTPGMAISPSSTLAFGTLEVGTTRDLSFTVSNSGGQVLSGSASLPAGQPFSLLGDASWSLYAGQSKTITVRYAPTSAVASSSTVTFASNAGTATRPVSGTGSLPPLLEVTAASTSFGDVRISTTRDLVCTVRNAGGSTLTGQASASGAGFSLVGSTSWSLAAGQSQSITVRFSPTLEQPYAGTVTFSSPAGSQALAFSGVGTNPPVLAVSPSSLAFGTVLLGSSKDLAFTVSNTGGGTLQGTASASGTGFSLVGAAGYVLGAGQSATVTVRFAPSVAGSASGSVLFPSGASGVAGLTRALGGTGAEALSFVLSSPAAGVTWTEGESRTIAWTCSQPGSGTVNLHYSLDNGLTWLALASGTANDGAQAWKVKAANTTTARIRITSVQQPSASATSEAFTILPKGTTGGGGGGGPKR